MGAYPNYLLDPSNVILDPASAINVITVGSIAQSNGLDIHDEDYVDIQPIANAGQPSPFTRVGTTQCIKPDLVDYGGTAVFIGVNQAVADGGQRPAAGIVTLDSEYLVRLFTTRSGTSFASPLVAFKAAQLRTNFPDASANLIRALLALSAEYPEGSRICTAGLSEDDRYSLLGYGQPKIESALASDDNRVILVAEDSLPIDKFAIYEVPIPEPFQTTAGERQIRVALAFHPPVRHTRLDYAGVSMSFRLIRGSNQAEVFDAFTKWEKAKGAAPKLDDRFYCNMKPGPQRRERGSLQCATFTAKKSLAEYGDRYFLAVRCEGGWAGQLVNEQRFALAVELRHAAQIDLYRRIRVRLRA